MPFEKFTKWFRPSRIDPKEKLRATMPALQELRINLKLAVKTRDRLTGIVLFFDLVSKCYDRGEVRDLITAFEDANSEFCYDGILDKLHGLEKHLKIASRTEFGWNRAPAGQRVTADRILVDASRYGLPTRPVSYWEEEREKRGSYELGSLRSPEVINQLVYGFMTTEEEAISHLITKLEAYVESK